MTIETANRLIVWAGVFALNLFLPYQFGQTETRIGWSVGMHVGILALWTVGAVAVARSRTLSFSLSSGGALIALSQLFPLAQIYAGFFGLGVARRLGLATKMGELNSQPSQLTEMGGFVATVLTGGALMTAALFFGLLIFAVVNGQEDEKYHQPNANW